MNKKKLRQDIARLRYCIDHWERNANGTSASVSRFDCALCNEYIEIHCDGCPIQAATGKPFCVGTPYVAAAKAWDDVDREEFNLAAKAEVEFLQKLKTDLEAQLEAGPTAPSAS